MPFYKELVVCKLHFLLLLLLLLVFMLKVLLLLLVCGGRLLVAFKFVFEVVEFVEIVALLFIFSGPPVP